MCNMSITIPRLFKKVNQLDPVSRQILKTWDSGQEAAEKLSGNKKQSGSISSCAKGKYGHKTAFGFAWEYADSVNKEEPPNSL